MSLGPGERVVERRKGLDAIAFRRVSGDSATEFDFESAYRFYVQASLLDARMLEELMAARRQAAHTWTSLHRCGVDLAVSLVATNQDGDVEAAISAVRAWDDTLLVQHLAALPRAPRGLGIALMQAWFDYVRPWTKVDYLAFFVNAKNQSANSFHEKLLHVGQAEGVTRASIAVWRRPAELARNAGLFGQPGRTLDGIDEPFVSAAARRHLGRTAASALGFLPGQFSLPRTTVGFGKIGLVRRRSLSVLADSGGAPRVAMIEESTSYGVNLTSFLSSTWLFPLDDELTADDLRSVAFNLRDHERNSGRLLMSSGGAYDASFAGAGFTKAYEIYLYVADHRGMLDYLHYIRRRHLGFMQSLRRRADRSAGR